MTQRLVSDAVWADILKLARAAAVRRAAIAYVTDTTSLPFRTGDTLVTDATQGAIASGSTDAHALSMLVNLGVHVYSVAGLHAKTMRLDDVAVIGSCNLSKRSREELIEAAVISDDEKLVAQVDAFIDALQEIGTRLTSTAIERLLRVPVVRSRGATSARKRTVMTADNTVWVLGLPETDDIDADEDSVASQMADVRREEGPDVEVDEFYWPKTGRFAKTAKVGDLVISVYRRDYHDRSPSKIRVYRPMWIKRIIPAGKNRDIGFVAAMPKRIARETVAWRRFQAMASAAGITVKPDGAIRLTERQWRVLSAQWITESAR